MLLSDSKYFITGSSGFVGTSVIKAFSKENFYCWRRNDPISLNDKNVLIHLAGKAHDFKKISNPKEYYEVNTELTKKVFDAFLISETSVIFSTNLSENCG